MSEKPEIQLIRNFKDIKVSLKALKRILKNQLDHSMHNYMFAWDVDLSKEFIHAMQDLLLIMDKLFGNTIDKTDSMVVEITKEGKR